jgi:hypothetical protein
MADTCGPNKLKVTLDDSGKSGFETRAKAKEHDEEAAKAIIRKKNECTGRCDQPEGKNRGCVRVGPDDDIEAALKIYSYKDADGDKEYGWYLDGTVETRCVCLPVAD